MHSPANFVPAKLSKACEYSGGPESPEPEKEQSHGCSSAASSRNDANSNVAMHLLFLEKYLIKGAADQRAGRKRSPHRSNSVAC